MINSAPSDEHASVAQLPSRIGSLGIATTWKVVTKQKVAKNVDTGTALVTKANAGQFG
jgi:ABC-type sugar transport system substrate-binding protein